MAKILLVLFLLLASIYPAFAREATPASITKEKVATREAALGAKLKNFKNQKKASAAARISENLVRINGQQTLRMLKQLQKMSSILQRLDAKNREVVLTAIADAKAKIASSEAEVNNQAEKSYTLQVTSESRVKQDAQKARDQLRIDLKTVRKSVIDTKQTVAVAIRVAKKGETGGQR